MERTKDKTKTIAFRLSPELSKAIEDHVGEKGNKSLFIRQSIRHHLKEREAH